MTGAREEANAHRPTLPRRLSTRILWFTMISIMLAEVAVFVPSVSKFRRDWLYTKVCLLYTSPSPRDRQKSRMPSSA